MRLLTMTVDGPLGAFGQRWFFIEAGLAVVAAILLTWPSRSKSKALN